MTEALYVRADELAALRAELDEARRRRDEWKAKAEGYDEVRQALREKVGAPWPPNLSRALWAGIAADEKKRADDAEAENAAAVAAERERCARIADRWRAIWDGSHHFEWEPNHPSHDSRAGGITYGRMQAADTIARAIRGESA